MGSRLLREDYHLDVEVSIIDFKDINAMSPDSAIRINGNRVTIAEGNRELSFTGNADELERIIDGLDAFGGYDVDISGTPLAGLGYVTTLPFRSNAGKFAFLITDKSYNISNCHGYATVYLMIEDLKEMGVNLAISYMTRATQGDQTAIFYRRWLDKINGIYIPMKDLDVSEYEFAEFVATNLIGEKNFQILKSTNLDKVELDGPLTKGGSTNSDDDTLTDSQEVNWDLITFKNGELQLPTLSYLWQWPGAVYDIKLIENMPWFATSQEQVILPIVSDPTSEDCDDDGWSDDVDDMPLKNNFTEAWIKYAENDTVTYIGQKKFGKQNIRVLVYTKDSSKPTVYSLNNGQLQQTNEDIWFNDDGNNAIIKNGKITVTNLDQKLLYDLNKMALNATQYKKLLDDFGVKDNLNEIENPEISVDQESQKLKNLGAAMGVIDSCLLEDGLGFKIYDIYGKEIYKLNFVISSKQVKSVLMQILGKDEDLLNTEPIYLRSKMDTEFAMCIVHAFVAPAKMAAGGTFWGLASKADISSGGMAILATGAAKVAGVVLIADGVYEAGLIVQSVGNYNNDKSNLEKATNSGKYRFPGSNKEMQEIFGVTDKVYHKQIKPLILKQIRNDSVYGKLFKKMGNNPDIGVDELGNIVFKNVKTKEILVTNWPFESFLP